MNEFKILREKTNVISTTQYQSEPVVRHSYHHTNNPSTLKVVQNRPTDGRISLQQGNSRVEGRPSNYVQPIQRTSAINKPTWMATPNQSSPMSNNFTFKENVGPNTSIANSRQSFHRNVGLSSEYGNASMMSPVLNKDRVDKSLLNAPDFNRTYDGFRQPQRHSFHQGLRPDQAFIKSHRLSSIARNRDRSIDQNTSNFYDLENRISRYVMYGDQTANFRNTSKQLDIFNEYSINDQSQASPRFGRESVSRAPQSQPRNTAINEVKAQTNLIRRRLKIFEGQLAEKDQVVEPKIEPEPDKPLKKQNSGEEINSIWIEKLKAFSVNPYEGKNVDELKKAYAVKQKELRVLEGKLIALNTNPMNLTNLEFASKILSAKLNFLKQKNKSIESERKVLKDAVNQKYNAFLFFRKATEGIERISLDDMAAKDGLVNKIEELKVKIDQCKSEIKDFDAKADERNRRFKELSEKNMTYEIETMRINLNNIDEDLIKELKYFLNKFE